jgi:hypothetical protein
MRSETEDNVRNLSWVVRSRQDWYNQNTMRMRLALVLTAMVAVPSAAYADATIFVARNSAGDDRATVRGFSFGVSLLIVGFEFEYANASEDETTARPSLRTTSGNVSVQTIGLPVQLYLTTGAGVYRERLAADQETAFAMNNGGGVKIPLAGPFRARVDYRVFTLTGNPRHTNVQRIYAGLNLSF